MNAFLDVMNHLREFNEISIIIRLFLPVLLGGMIGMERSKNGRAAGLRTHILVCLGATIASMTGLYINEMCGGSGDISRIAAQVISGIGWLGCGTIIVRNKAMVTGLTTAACIWAVGTIGIAIGYGFYEAAIIGTLLIFFITKTLNALDTKLRRNMKEVSVYIEFVDAKVLNKTIAEIQGIGVEIDDVVLVEAKTNLQDGIGAELIGHIHKSRDTQSFVEQLNENENISFAILTTY